MSYYICAFFPLFWIVFRAFRFIYVILFFTVLYNKQIFISASFVEVLQLIAPKIIKLNFGLEKKK